MYQWDERKQNYREAILDVVVTRPGRQELRRHVVQLHDDGERQFPQDAGGRRRVGVLCSSALSIIWVYIDADDAARRVCDSLRGLHCGGQAHDHAKVEHGNCGQSASVVHVGNGCDVLGDVIVT